ncbi:hypothetical protein GCM10009661_60710 [Catellatospora chokoriensis]|uniref:Aminotransferase class V domain-containing protein n=1 Tax=Catellatospora chokoriensis TaxID=310353 RepID=A0A8J3K5D8_9ACTN|nr:hypothetical protein Cch02nite_64810 [Catellatospora chokoriensis]
MNSHPALIGEPIYLDYNATTPVDPAVVASMQPYLDTRFGNPASDHHYATAPADALATARGQVAALIGADPAGIVFTGSGSESDNLAIRGTVLAHPGHRRHVITQATEHPAVLATCHALHRLHGVDVTVLPVARDGLVDPRDLRAAITPHTTLTRGGCSPGTTGARSPRPCATGIRAPSASPVPTRRRASSWWWCPCGPRKTRSSARCCWSTPRSTGNCSRRVTRRGRSS